MLTPKSDLVSRLASPALRVACGAVALLVCLASSSVVHDRPAIADPEPEGTELPTVSADLLPTPQINGVAWVTRIVGNTVFVGGKFSSARPFGAAPGSNEQARMNLLAFDLKTGALLQSFAPKINGEVKAMTASQDGKTLYIGGLFTAIDGQEVFRVAAFDVASGKRITTFRPYLDYRVAGLAVHGDTLYAVGKFNTANRSRRSNAAAFNRHTGQVLPWNPSPNAAVSGVAVSPSGQDVVIAGQFDQLAGKPKLGWAATAAATGADRQWPVPRNLTNHGIKAGFTSVRSDREFVFLTGYSFDSKTAFEGTAALRWSDGGLENINGSKGDHYDAAPAGGVLYAAGHAHDLEPIGGMPEQTNRTYRYVSALSTRRARDGRTNTGSEFGGMPAPELLHWYPDFLAGTATGQNQAIWSVDATTRYVVVAGEFPLVNGRKQQGIARFGALPVAPLKEGVRDVGRLNPEYSVNAGGQVSVKFTGLFDRDSRALTYRLLRGDKVVDTVTISGLTEWHRGSRLLVDRNAPNGTHRYAISVVDNGKNRWVSDRMPVTVAGTVGGSAYRTMVASDGAAALWRLDEGTGKVLVDDLGQRHLFRSHLSKRVFPGAIAQDRDGGNTFDGVSLGEKPLAVASRAEMAPTAGSIEAWIKTKSSQGGMIVSFGDSKSEHSTRADRNILMRTDGRLVATGGDSGKSVVSPKAYNDGAWHHVVLTMTGGITRLSVDGKAVVASTGARPTSYRGYWRIGGDNTKPWASGAEPNFVGQLDNVAYYPKPLSTEATARHYRVSRDQTQPIAEFSVEHNGNAVMFNGKPSSSPGSEIVKYEWVFGDGKTGTGWVRTNVYQRPGTYQVSLKVTDKTGQVATTTRPIHVSGRMLVRSLTGDLPLTSKPGANSKTSRKVTAPDPKLTQPEGGGKNAWRQK